MLINFLSILRKDIVVTICNPISGEDYITDTVERLLNVTDYLSTHPVVRSGEVVAWEGEPPYEKIWVYVDC